MRPLKTGALVGLVIALGACGGGKLGTSASSPEPSMAPLAASAPALPNGEVGLAYTAPAPAVTGGVAPYTCQVTTGSLPAGLTLAENGAITGSPAGAGDL
jgi:large repetitive protein